MKIVRTKQYLKDLKRIGASARDVAALEGAIVTDPTTGAVVSGLGGVRKIRFGLGNKGKRGGGRAIYYFIIAGDVVLMIGAYSKSEKSDLTSTDRKIIAGILKEAADE